METPSSTRRVTRSQTLGTANKSNNNNKAMSKKTEESEKNFSKSRQRDAKQQALIDITNDSPIIGLAMGSLETPSSFMSKKKTNCQAKHMTPGSGEALLRGQVKTLLQKVEEEAELLKLSLERRPFVHLRGLFNSPMSLLAPTPANTPHILNLSGNGSGDGNAMGSGSLCPVEDKFIISEIVTEMFDGKKQGLESEKSLITRSLLLDFSEKTDGSDNSFGGESEGSEKVSTNDDDYDDGASIWSIQANASSTRDEEDDDEERLGEEGEKDDDYYEDEEEEGGLVDELCEGISKINVNGGGKTMSKFTGKHTRFVYNSDGELEREEESDDCGGENESSSSYADSLDVLRLKGLPTPKGKHLRFPQDLEDN